MCTPIRVGLVAAGATFLATLMWALPRHDVINGHTLTPLEQLPSALVAATIFSTLTLLGTWLGMRCRESRHLTYRAGLAVSLLFVTVTFIANAITAAGPRTVTFPSHDANILGIKLLLISLLWGIGVPYTISLVVSRFKFLGISNGP